MPSLRTALRRVWTGNGPSAPETIADVDGVEAQEGKESRATIDTAIAEGESLFAQGRFAAALAVTDGALAQAPKRRELLFARGSVLFGWGRFIEAYENYRRAADAGLEHPDLDLQLGWSCVSVGLLGDAEAYFRKVVAAAPESMPAYIALVNVLEMRGTLAPNAAEMATGLSRWQNDYDAMNFLGGCKLHQADRDGAIEAFRRAIVIDSKRPRAWINLGTALDWSTHLPEALAAFELACELEVAHGIVGEGFVNLAVAMREQGRRVEALDLLRRSLARNPDVNGHVLYSMMLLEMGQFEEGWVQHEFRWLKEPLRSIRWTIRRPQWSGQDLREKTIVLHAEQGFGDAIQFIRYAPTLKSLGAKVLFDPFRGFNAISESFDGLDEVLRDGKMPHFDFHLPLLSLPRVLGGDAASIPSNIPYLSIQPSYLEKWSPRLAVPGKLKVGLVWAGNPKHPRDYQRSIPALLLAPLQSVEGVQFYSLQKTPKPITESPALPLDLIDLGPELDDYCDTAAIVSMLDLVISVDTSVAHLAGALGKPVWLMLPIPPDWRWLLEGERTPWYPTMRLFRQQERNRWDTVIEEIRVAMQKLVSWNERDVVTPTPLPIGAATVEQPHASPVRSRVRPSQPASRLSRVTEARYGLVQYLPDASFAAESLEYYGEFRQAELDLVGRFLRPGASVLEVGAGIGVNTLFLAKTLGESGHVLAYEPDPLLHQLARQNLAANQVGNVSLLRRTLGRAPGEESAGDEPGRAAPSPADWIDGLGLKRLDWIKVNGGSSVVDVLAGGVATLWRLRPWLFISLQSDAELSGVAEAARDHGYQPWQFESPIFNGDNYNRRDDDLFQGRHARGVLCIPEEINMDIDLEGCTSVALKIE